MKELRGLEAWRITHPKAHTTILYLAGLALGIGLGYHICLLKQAGCSAGISVFALLGL